MTLILILFTFTLTHSLFSAVVYVVVLLLYGICVDILTLIVFVYHIILL